MNNKIALRTNSATNVKKNTVEEMLIVLNQADKNSIVKNEKGVSVSAYIDIFNKSVVIVDDDK
jgi:hypothetical protein